MPFVFTWTNVDPADPTAANLLGKDIRDLRSAIQERMDANFCDPSGSWAASDPTHPLVLAAAIKGNVIGKTFIVHHSAFHNPFVPNTAITAASALFLNPVASATAIFRAPLPLPIGVTITSADFLINVTGGGTPAFTLNYNDFTAPAPATTIVSTVPATDTGVTHIVTSGALTHVVLATKTYFLEFQCTSGNNFFYAARITYDTPGSGNTI